MEEKLNFNISDPWHVSADLMFGFVCQHCDNAIHFDDLPECDPEDKFEESCVLISKQAQKLGWKLIEEFSFSCPSCSKGKQGA